MKSAILEKGEEVYNKLGKIFLLAQNTRDNSEIAYIEKLLVEKLFEINIQISEAILLKKYFIWNQLYLERKIEVNDEDIIMYINKVLDDMGL
ncbi:hypothetical protein ACH36K_10065 [Clostridium sp. MB05]|uniref:hypothetical protein n=1 Tax=Clostridium sp. MB05 TaxID=3376682 RepID=UPI00398295DB